MSLDHILLASVKAGGRKVRLVPGRRIVIQTPTGELEAQGPEQTPSTIDQLLAPILTTEARQALVTAGLAEWALEVPGVGPVRARAERRPGGTFATFTVGGATGLMPTPTPAAAPSPAPRAPGPAAEMEERLKGPSKNLAIELPRSRRTRSRRMRHSRTLMCA